MIRSIRVSIVMARITYYMKDNQLWHRVDGKKKLTLMIIEIKSFLFYTYHGHDDSNILKCNIIGEVQLRIFLPLLFYL